jgi:DNA-binding FrmR family transcriptional regulator
MKDTMNDVERTTVREESLKEDLLKRLARVEGQVRGVTKMVEDDVYCDKVLHQISAIRASLEAVGKLVLENHLRCCFVERVQAGDTKVVDELMVTVKTLLK